MISAQRAELQPLADVKWIFSASVINSVSNVKSLTFQRQREVWCLQYKEWSSFRSAILPTLIFTFSSSPAFIWRANRKHKQPSEEKMTVKTELCLKGAELLRVTSIPSFVSDRSLKVVTLWLTERFIWSNWSFLRNWRLRRWSSWGCCTADYSWSKGIRNPRSIHQYHENECDQLLSRVYSDASGRHADVFEVHVGGRLVCWWESMLLVVYVGLVGVVRLWMVETETRLSFDEAKCTVLTVFLTDNWQLLLCWKKPSFEGWNNEEVLAAREMTPLWSVCFKTSSFYFVWGWWR